jgi:hypothetical protein
MWLWDCCARKRDMTAGALGDIMKLAKVDRVDLESPQSMAYDISAVRPLSLDAAY